MNTNYANRWRVAATSVIGTSHQRRGQPCQDAHHWKILPEGILVAAVADGAGSAELAEVGADVAADAAVEAICQLQTIPPPDDEGWKLLLTAALKGAQKSVEAEADVRKARVRDLASTLILVVATPELVAAAQVGDGAAVVMDRQGEITAITTPQRGEYANQTTFLISPNALETAQFKILPGTPAQLAIFSDGLQRLALKMPEGKPHQPFFSPLFRFVTQMKDTTVAQQQLGLFLKSARVTERTDDDLTLLLASFN